MVLLLFLDRQPQRLLTHSFLGTGILGAFTTFSTLIGETGGFLSDRQWFYATANFALQNAGGLILYFLGSAAGRAL